jgi:hypothetical protein
MLPLKQVISCRLLPLNALKWLIYEGFSSRKYPTYDLVAQSLGFESPPRHQSALIKDSQALIDDYIKT